jgi:hypothetical protein
VQFRDLKLKGSARTGWLLNTPHTSQIVKWKPGFSRKMFWTIEIPPRQVLLYKKLGMHKGELIN